MSLFRKGKTIVLVHKDYLESDEHFIERGNFIAKQNPKSIQEYNESSIYSKIHINCKYLGCEYDPNIMKKLKEKQLSSSI